MIQRYKYSIAK